MRSPKLAIAVMACGAVALPGASPVFAHHSVAQGFEMDQLETVTGKITKMEFINPHSRLFLEVEDDKGEMQSWTAWFGSANALFRRGWRVTDLPVGEMVSVNGHPARDGSLQLYGDETILPDGRTLFGGTAPGER